jgi:hypothetical protein
VVTSFVELFDLARAKLFIQQSELDQAKHLLEEASG